MMTKEKISDYFIEMLNHLETKTSPKYPNLIFYLYNDKIYIEYNQINNWAFLNSDKIWLIFKTNYSYNHMEIKELTSVLVEKHFKLKGVNTANSFHLGFDTIEKELKLIK